MSRFVRPYVGAAVDRRHSSTVPTGPLAGASWTLTLYRDHASSDSGESALVWTRNPGAGSNVDEMRAAVRDLKTPHGVAAQPEGRAS